MDYIFCNPQIPRFEWENYVFIHNLLQIGVSPDRIILLTTSTNSYISDNIYKYFGVKSHQYPDNRSRSGKSYSPSIKPYLMGCYFNEFPDMVNHDYLYSDSDLIFKKDIEIKSPDKVILGSDCDNYLGHDYVYEKNYEGSDLEQEIADCLKVSKDNFNSTGIGAQYAFHGLPSQYWQTVYQDSINLHSYFVKIEKRYLKEYKKTDDDILPIQRWCAEMWATWLDAFKFGFKSQVDNRLSFCWSSWKKDAWENEDYNILHNSGVTSKSRDEDNLFYKVDYYNKSPLLEIDNLLATKNPEYCNYIYLQQIKETRDYIKGLQI